MANERKVIIVGGGFGGVTAALKLDQLSNGKLDITLISDQPHFEYHAALYRVVAGRSPLEVCIPLSEIFSETNVKVVEDSVTDINNETNQVLGREGSKYLFDKLIFAIGSQTAYYDIPGLKDHSFSVKTIHEALKLKSHLHQLFENTNNSSSKLPIHVVIAGGGPTGIEIAGELSTYLKAVLKDHNLPQSAAVIELFEAGKSLLPRFPRWAQKVAEKRLKKLGVSIFLETPILKEDVESAYMPQMKLKTKTVIWTAGVAANDLVKSIKLFSLDKRGRILVDNYLRAENSDSIFVIGDAASTADSGTAVAAINQAESVVSTIWSEFNGDAAQEYVASKPIYAVPIGPAWAIYHSGHFHTAGAVGWVLRRLIDLRFFNRILPFSATLRAMQDGRTIFETCPKCSTVSNDK